MTTSKRSGMITATPSAANGYKYVVSTDDGDTVYLSGIGAPKNAEVGDVGTVTYQTFRNSGFYAWSPNN